MGASYEALAIADTIADILDDTEFTQKHGYKPLETMREMRYMIAGAIDSVIKERRENGDSDKAPNNS